ncbi:MAG: hypothetical protein JSV78_08960 [Phycisphaerales bacterium]|nr:MAG: hypothetical protein JSV78_08960 [Phycisphaerales bacterium]
MKRLHRVGFILTVVLLSGGLCTSIAANSASAQAQSQTTLAQAVEHARLASEGFSRCRRYVDGWLKYADPATGLIPRNLRERYWNAKDSAADNYPFMVLTAALTDRDLYEGRMLDMLRTETRLTSRIDSLPDTWSFQMQGFQLAEPALDRIMFGSSEYVKDGLLPLAEYLGPSPWRDRMLAILDDMWKHAPIDTPFGRIVAADVEVNGEMLQTLSRVYWMTGDQKYLDWAIRLGDYYLLGGHHPTRNRSRLKLRDHECEIVSGLCELYAALHFARPEKAKAYQKPIHEMLDRILEVGRNEHGLFYNVINPQAGSVVDRRIADTWGYTYNGYYTVFLVDGTETYRAVVRGVLRALYDHYRNHEWQGDNADGYADAIEGALNLYNREPVESAAMWIDSEIRVMWAKQKRDGLIDAWHCDGNFARTTIMYCLWKTAGVTIRPWRADVQLGAVRRGGSVVLVLSAGSPWEGSLRFDTPRHRTHMGLPLDWPRINQFPEWFVVEADEEYAVYDLHAEGKASYSGRQLAEGLAIALGAGEVRGWVVQKSSAGETDLNQLRVELESLSPPPAARPKAP